MQRFRVLSLVVIVAAVATLAAADTKVVKASHTDAFSMMGKTQPAQDEQNTIWLGDGRMRMDQGDSSFIVRADENKMYIVEHDDKKYFVLDLPIDPDKLLPPEMAKQMMQMMKFEATVTPSDETKKVGEWTARRYDVTMNSAMSQMKMVVWATKDIAFDYSGFNSLFEQTKLLAPGMQDVVDEMRKIDGFQVESTTTMSMMGSDMKMSERTLSVEEGTPPAGTYDPPAGYKAEPFDFLKMQQMKGK